MTTLPPLPLPSPRSGQRGAAAVEYLIVLSLLVLAPFALLLLWLTARRLPKETPEARMARAIAAGEPPPQGQ